MSTLTIRPQTADEAFRYIIGRIQKKDFYHQHGYHVDLPEHPAFQKVWDNPNFLTDEKTEELRSIFARDVYPLIDFSSVVNIIVDINKLILTALSRIEKLKTNWDFNLLDNYLVLLTVYGPGGSYETNGTIILKVNNQKRSYQSVIIHEIVHIGIEHLVKKYSLDHSEKERLVDLLCWTAFSDLFPEYLFQEQGNPALDRFINKETLENLPLALEKYKSEK